MDDSGVLMVAVGLLLFVVLLLVVAVVALFVRRAPSDRRLEDMRKKVDDQLQEFKKLVSGVDSLQRILTNVKSRGTWAEFQLGGVFDDVLGHWPRQYKRNVKIKQGIVDYAVVLPDEVYLPVDSKFPMEDYHRLRDAQEKSDADLAEKFAKSLASAIKRQAKAIREKYVDPPRTTDFAVMYLATEGLFAEVLRCPGLAESIQKEHRVMVAGPTTLAALLSSLTVGFKTLAVQKKAKAVLKSLTEVEKEVRSFSKSLDKAKNKLEGALGEVDRASKDSARIKKTLEELPVLDASPASDARPSDSG